VEEVFKPATGMNIKISPLRGNGRRQLLLVAAIFDPLTALYCSSINNSGILLPNKFEGLYLVMAHCAQCRTARGEEDEMGMNKTVVGEKVPIHNMPRAFVMPRVTIIYLYSLRHIIIYIIIII